MLLFQFIFPVFVYAVCGWFLWKACPSLRMSVMTKAIIATSMATGKLCVAPHLLTSQYQAVAFTLLDYLTASTCLQLSALQFLDVSKLCRRCPRIFLRKMGYAECNLTMESRTGMQTLLVSISQPSGQLIGRREQIQIVLRQQPKDKLVLTAYTLTNMASSVSRQQSALYSLFVLKTLT